MPCSLVDLEVSLFAIYIKRAHTYQTYTHTSILVKIYFLLINLQHTHIYTTIKHSTLTHVYTNITNIYRGLVAVSDIKVISFVFNLYPSFSVSLPGCDNMPDTKIFQLLPNDKDIAAIHNTDSLLVPSNPRPPESSLSPSLKENKSRSDGNNQQQDQDQDQEQEQEKLQYESRSKRKWEYNDETSRVEILETPRNSNIRCYCPPRPPRKPKASPAVKRRDVWLKRSVVFLDVAREVESMFPPSVIQDFGKKIKKARY